MLMINLQQLNIGRQLKLVGNALGSVLKLPEFERLHKPSVASPYVDRLTRCLSSDAFRASSLARSRGCGRILGQSLVLLGLLLVGSPSLSASSPVITFQKLVDSNTAVPAMSGETFGRFGKPVLENGRVAFQGFSPSNDIYGIYSWHKNQLEVVVDTNTIQPGNSSNSTFSGLGSVWSNISLSGNEVAFRGISPDYIAGIYVKTLGPAGGIRTVADTNTTIPGSDGDTFIYYSLSDLSLSNGAVVFTGDDAAPPFPGGVYTDLGGSLRVVMDRPTSESLGYSPPLYQFTDAMIDGNEIVLTHIAGSNKGFKESNGSFSKLVDPDNNQLVFDDYSFSGGDLGFVDSTSRSVKTLRDGVFTTIAETSTVIPEHPEKTFAGFNDPAISEDLIAFIAPDSYISNNIWGLYTQFGDDLLNVIEPGDAFDGRVVEEIRFGREGASHKQLVFTVQFTDDSEAVYLATVPEPASIHLVLLSLGLILVRVRWRGVFVQQAPV